MARRLCCPHCGGRFVPAVIPSTELRRRILFAQIYVARHFGIFVDELRSSNRVKSVVHPRKVAYTVVRDATGASFPELGELFRRDHSTIQAGINSIRRQAAADPKLAAELARLTEALRNGFDHRDGVAA